LSARTKSHHLHGQQAIDSDRVTQIQQALIRAHYLTGAPTGNWDDGTKAAMQKYQGDQGWQTKLMPDSRALIKLGLGPNGGSSEPTPSVAATVPASNEANTLATAHSIMN